MIVILKEDITGLGLKNDILTVKSGYARNFLIPKKMAVVANEGNRKNVEEIIRQQAKKYQQQLEEIKAIAAKLSKDTIKVGAKVGQNGKIFGSVTTLQIASALKEQKDQIVDRKKITISDEIKELGTYKATVVLHRDIDPVEIKFEVIEE